MSPPKASRERGLTPFAWFGIAIVIGATYALFMGLSYYNVPTFTTGALPTIAGVAVAVVAFLVIGLWAPSNE
jgi:membrane-bound acyltransferase YfiQ involved in biofilm formation